MRISRTIAAVIIGGTALSLVVSLVLWSSLGEQGIAIALSLSTGLILLAVAYAYEGLHAHQAKCHHSLIEKTNNDYRQLEALSSLLWTLTPDLPLPRMRGWTSSPDFLKELAEIILATRPALVVETGSGVGTLVTAYCLRRLGQGKVVSLEHDPKYAKATRATLELHDLQEVATVVDAPLTTVDIGGTMWRWYDVAGLHVEQPIDVLIVDGPPDATQALARYPAIPILREHMHEGSIVVADNAKADDERQVIAMWEREFAMQSDFVDTETGACVLRQQTQAAQAK